MRDNQVQLGNTKNIKSVNTDTYTKVNLDNSVSGLIEYDIKNILSVTEIFDKERQENEIYRIYGGIEYLSLFNGIKKNYTGYNDFFQSKDCVRESNCEYKNIFDDFKFYLVRPSKEVTSLGNNSYIRYLEVIATPTNFELYEAGFSKNIFNNQKYIFSFNIDFNISGVVDGFGMPLTDLYLYCEYNPGTVPYGVEKIERYVHTNSQTGSYEPYSPTPLEIGDLIYGDVVKYNEKEISQEITSTLKYRVLTPFFYYMDIVETLKWVYEPLIPIKLQYFSNEVSRGNSGSTSYDKRNEIPYYAKDLGNGNYIWRDILEQGYIDPLTGRGVDYPFVNGKRYLFSNLILSMSPDLTDDVTKNIFHAIKFDDPTTININSIEDSENIGKPC